MALGQLKQGPKTVEQIAFSLGIKGIDEATRILRKLEKDDFVIKEPSLQYSITHEGEEYIGYVNQRILDEKRLISIDQMAIATKKYNKRLLWATWCAGIVGGLLLLWQIWRWFYPQHKDFVHRNDVEKNASKKP